MTILDVKNLTIEFQSERGWLPAVTDVSFHLRKGEILALVGESGCGKSISCMSLARLLPSPPARIARGEVLLTCRNGETENVLNLTPRQLRKIRGGEIAYIFQEPSVSLNPVFRIGRRLRRQSNFTGRMWKMWNRRWRICSGRSGFRVRRSGCASIRTSFREECSSG